MKPTDATEIARLRLDREEAFTARHEAREAWRKRGVEIEVPQGHCRWTPMRDAK